MSLEDPKTVSYQRSRFVTQLPVGCLYGPSHFWIAPQAADVWRVGLTRFGTRMLGEIVEQGLEVERESVIRPGQIIGWIEGFKAITDLVSLAEGWFLEGNPALQEQITLVNRDPHGAGWLYAVRGKPDSRCVDVSAYARILDRTIDRMLEKREAATDE